MKNRIINLLKIITLLYLFFLSIDLLGFGFKVLGKDFAEIIIKNTKNPIISLFIGIISTAIVQSSSLTTSMTVAMVAAGTITLKNAVPIIMGANIGTTITNIIVSFLHINRKEEFRLGFSAAIVHDIFNLFCTAIFFPLQLLTGIFDKIGLKAALLFTGSKNIEFESPIKIIVKPVKNFVYDIIKFFTNSKYICGVSLIFISLIILFFALLFIVKIMRKIMENKIEITFNNIIDKAPILGIVLGTIITMTIQSSSVTTSMLVPIVAAGALSIETAFSITLGANIGTTITAILASFAGNVYGLAIALVHLFFNLFGVLIFAPFKTIRNIPVKCALKFGELAAENKKLAIIYVLIIFFVLPILIMLIYNVI